jgi:hypothetical protein
MSAGGSSKELEKGVATNNKFQEEQLELVFVSAFVENNSGKEHRYGIHQGDKGLQIRREKVETYLKFWPCIPTMPS